MSLIQFKFSSQCNKNLDLNETQTKTTRVTFKLFLHLTRNLKSSEAQKKSEQRRFVLLFALFWCIEMKVDFAF